ncbi:MAG: hypothetical protein GYB64_02910, partial [Chloroflexi bacterium]|nr:hypothetical protein [Chloroflexota bacterium]
MDSLRQGIEAAKAGQRDVARRHLAEAIRADPNNETAWLWMSGVVSSPQERIQCLQRVLAINPSNEVALRGLRALGVEPDVATPEPPPTPSPAEVTDIPPPAEVTASYEPIEAEEELPAYAYDSPIPVPDADALEAARHAVSGVLRDLDDEAALGELGIMWQRQASSQVRQSVTP